jgi:CRP-like cAMP-binding protein
MEYESLKKLFRSLAPFSDEELDEAMKKFYPESLNRNDYFCKAGRIADRIAYVNRGVLRSFYLVIEKEITTFFQLPGSMAVALPSFLQLTPSSENIQALEDTELIVIHRKDLYKLYEDNWKWQQVGRILMEQYYIRLEEHMISLQSETAVERYERLLTRFPEVFQSVQLQYIASYLGISPETLSRIRKSK